MKTIELKEAEDEENTIRISCLDQIFCGFNGKICDETELEEV